MSSTATFPSLRKLISFFPDQASPAPFPSSPSQQTRHNSMLCRTRSMATLTSSTTIAALSAAQKTARLQRRTQPLPHPTHSFLTTWTSNLLLLSLSHVYRQHQHCNGYCHCIAILTSWSFVHSSNNASLGVCTNASTTSSITTCRTQENATWRDQCADRPTEWPTWPESS